MDVCINWVKEYCDCNLPAEEIAEVLTRVGLEVEQVDTRSGEDVLVTEVTSNRGDLLSIIGVARDLAAYTKTKHTVPEVKLVEKGEPVEKYVTVEIPDIDLCPRYTARVLTDVKVGPSPQWMQKKLIASGLRPVNNVVDITNYVLYECGQPLHAFDYDKLEGGKIIARRAKKGEIITSIDGRKHELFSEMLVIADANRPVAVAGVMGGLDTEVSGSTKTVLLESAEFEPYCIRKTARALNLATDSSYRFERGVDPEGVLWASARAAQLMVEYAGAKLCVGVVDCNYSQYKKAKVTLRIPRIKKILGIEIPQQRAKEILISLGFEVAGESAGTLEVFVPSFRARDVSREIDLIEEVGRIYGFDKIEAAKRISLFLVEENKTEVVEEKLRRLLTGAGFYEAVTVSLTSQDVNDAISPWADGGSLQVQNESFKKHGCLRKSVIGSLLTVKKGNQDVGTKEVHLFEMTKIFTVDKNKPHERKVLSILSDGGFLQLKGVLDVLFNEMGVSDKITYESAAYPFCDKNKCASLYFEKKPIGLIGVLSKQTADKFDLENIPVVSELDLDILTAEADLVVKYKKLSKFPAIERDLAIVVDEDVVWRDIVDVIEKLEIAILEDMKFFDEYRGKQIPPGKKSIAFSLTFRSNERTLEHQEIDHIMENVMDKLTSTLGAALRA